MAVAKTTSLDTISKALELDQLEEGERNDILADIGELIFRSSMVRFIERMDDQTKDKFDALMKRSPTDEAIAAFIEQHDADPNGVVSAAVQALTNDILAVTA